jgi:DNA-binding GntR family transcriptional regulator
LISRNCAEERDLSSHKADAVAAARNLPSLKRTVLNKRRVLKRFLAAHPQRTLTPDDYATYRALRAEFRLAIRRYNRKVRAFNRLADRFNSVLLACKIG